VSTAAARYQNLAINQAKLSGQCGRLKCCLNYELDTYMEALSNFPDDAEKLRTQNGIAVLVKTDIFKGLMYYGYEHEHGRGRMYALDLEQVRMVKKMNRRGELPPDLAVLQVIQEIEGKEEPDFGAGDVTGVIELPMEERRRRKKKRKGKGGREDAQSSSARPETQDGPQKSPPEKKEGSGNKGRGRGGRQDKKREDSKPDQPNTPQAQAPGQLPGEKREGDRGARKGKSRRNRGRGGKGKGDNKQE
jgi:hypothetical protein